MNRSKSCILALAAAFWCSAAVPGRCQNANSSGLLEARPTIRFCDYTIEQDPTLDVRPGYRPPLAQQIQTNSYWEVEQTATAQQAPPVTEIPAPPPENGNFLSEPPLPSGMACSTGCAGGCTSCGGCDHCCACVRPLQFIAAAEATFFWPQLKRDFIQTTVDNSLGQQTILSDASTASVEGGLMPAPRITIGVQGCKWGLVGRYWNASAGDNGYSPTIPAGPGMGLVAFDDFQAYTVDMEVQRRFVGCKWQWYTFGGFRYASINNDRFLQVQNQFGTDPLLTSSGFAGQQFNGAGLTFGMSGFCKLRECSPLSLYYLNRYGFLWGRGSASAQTSATAVDAGALATTFNNADAENNGDLFIGELQFGIQWMAKLNCVPGTAFIRTGLEYQYWDTNSGISVGADSTAFINGFETSAEVTAGDMLFHMIGLNIGAGILF